MKTIKQHCDKRWNESQGEFSVSNFKEGVEFAQRWIPIEEPPEKNINVLLKRSHPFHLYEACGFLRDGVFYSNEIAKPFTNVTHWRPINRI